MAGITTQTEIAGPINVVYQTEMLRRAQAVCPYFVGSKSAEIRSHRGTFTAQWRRYEHVTPTTTPLTELTGQVVFPTRTAIQPSITDITATVQKYGQFMFLGEEMDLVNIEDVSMEVAGVLGEQAGRSLNRLQRNELEDNSTAILAGAATTATAIGATQFISRTLLARVVNELQRQDAMKFLAMTRGSVNIGTAPVRESFWAFCHPDTEEDLRTLTGFNSVETYAGQTETEVGEIGHVGGVRFIATTESTIDAGSGATVTSTATISGRETSNRADLYSTVVIGKEFHGSLGFDNTHIKSVYRPEDRLPSVMMISHAKGSGGVADPLNEVASIGWKTWHAAKILNSNWGRVVRHTASKLTV